MERINPYRDHRLEVTVRDGRLVIRKKPRWLVDDELVDLYEQRAKRDITRELIPRHPEDFHVRFIWDETIAYDVVNPAADASWPAEVSGVPAAPTGLSRLRGSVRRAILAGIRWMFSQRQRNRTLDITPDSAVRPVARRSSPGRPTRLPVTAAPRAMNSAAAS